MSETLWKRLCTADVPAKYAAIANRARASLARAWAALSPGDLASVGRLLRLDADGTDLLCSLARDHYDLYRAAVHVRGLEILVMEVGGPFPAPGPRVQRTAPPGKEKRWGGAPLEYVDCGLPWFAAVRLELSARPLNLAR